MEQSNQNLKLVATLISVGLIVLSVYLLVKSFSEWVHLDMHAAGLMLVGGVVVLLALGVALWQEWPLLKVLAWMPFLFIWFLIPALDYWSVEHGPFVMHTEPEWYGIWWPQAIGVIGLAGFGYGMNKKLEDQY